MNISLYEEIISKLNSLPDEDKKPENIRNLMGQWMNRGNYTDMTSVLCAFYVFMDGKSEYAFIENVSDWKNFFGERFVNHFTIDTIKGDFDNIVKNEQIIDIILKFTSETVQKEFYEYACILDTMGKENGIDVYGESRKLLETKLVEKGLISKPIELDNDISIPGVATVPEEIVVQNVINESVISESPEKPKGPTQLTEEIRNLESERKGLRDNIFGDTSKELGLEAEVLIGLVGDEKSLEIEGIDVRTETIDKLTSKDSRIASLPNNSFKKLAERLNKRSKLKRMGVEIVNNNGSKTMYIVKKDTVFDKIATTSQTVLKGIKKGAAAAGKVVIGGIIVGALATERIIEFIGKASDFVMEKASSVKEAVSPKIAEGLRTIADKISPQPDIILQNGYIEPTADMSDPKVILSAGTQVATIPMLNQKSMAK